VTVDAEIAIISELRMKPKRGLLVRVAADQSEGGGHWNGPVDSRDGSFAYVPIPESKSIRPGMQKPYQLVSPALTRFNLPLPSHLAGQSMHLDPDFDHLTYGDQGQRAKQILTKLTDGDLLVFYAGMRDVNGGGLVYALIGLYVIEAILPVNDVPKSHWDRNAHTRRHFEPGASDIVVTARRELSGRLSACIPIGEFRDRAYRVTKPLLAAWGGISVNDGYLQRSARLPELNDAVRFYDWFQNQKPKLLPKNN
jgi:hypothetical protein